MKEGIGCLAILVIAALIALAMYSNPDGESNVTIDAPSCSNCEYRLFGSD